MVSETRDSPIGKIPGNWEVRPLASFCSKIGTGATPRGGQAVYLTERLKHALIRSQHVFDRHFDFDDLVFISDEHAYELRYAEVQSDDLLLNITGDGVTFGRACLVPEAVLPARVNQHVSIIRVDPSVCSPDYLLSFFTHPLAKPYIESFNSGGSRRAITKGNIESFEIPLPPIAEQKRIADILGTLDDKIELNRRMNETLERMAQSIFKSWFVDFDPVKRKAEGGRSKDENSEPQPFGFNLRPSIADLFPSSFQDSDLGKIPEGWEVKTIHDVTSLIIDYRGKTPKKLAADWATTGIPAVSAKNIKNGRLVRLDAMNFVDDELYEKWMKDELAINDILMTSEAPLGELYFLALDSRYCLSQRVYGIRANPDICEPAYLYLWLESAACQSEMKSRATGTTVVGIRQSELRKVRVLVPPIQIQRASAKIVANVLRRVHSNEQESASLAALRDTLLPRLLSGELAVPAAMTAVEGAI